MVDAVENSGIQYPVALAYLVAIHPPEEDPDYALRLTDELGPALLHQFDDQEGELWLLADDRLGGQAQDLDDDYLLSLEPEWPDHRTQLVALYLAGRQDGVEELLDSFSALERHALGPLLEELQQVADPIRGQRATDGRFDAAGQSFWYQGANPAVDLVVQRGDRVLLIRRGPGGACPGQWALPGGFHDTAAGRGQPWQAGQETAAEAALRELVEETRLEASHLRDRMSYVGFFDSPGRDPRNNPSAWAVSNAFYLDLPEDAEYGVQGSDDAVEAAWISLEELEELPLAFDHRDILRRAGLL